MDRILHSYVTHLLEIIVKEGFWIWGMLSYVSVSFLCAVADSVRTYKVRDGESNCRKAGQPSLDKMPTSQLRGWF